MAKRCRLVGGCAALALAIPLLAVGGSAADQPSIAGTGNAGARCKLTAASPTEANDRITGNGSIRCRTSRSVHMHIETQMLQQGQWGTFGSFDGDVRVRAGRTRHVSTGPANCKGLGQAQVRTVLRLVKFPRTLAQTTSPIVQIACSGHGGMPNASCPPSPQPPTSANGQISASGTVTCSAHATLDVDLQLQVYNNGSWQQASDVGRGGFDAAANTTYSFTTPATACGPPPSPGAPPPPPEQWRSSMMVDAGTGPITNVSPVVVLTTC